MMISLKSVIWQGSSLEDLQEFPLEAKRNAGFQLDKVQRGLEPDDWKPLHSVGPGVREIRIRATDRIYRVVYVANIGESVFVLHAFQKQTQRTPQTDLELARSRFKAIGRNRE